MIDEKISHYVKQALETAKKIIEDNKDKMDKIVNVLITKETIEKKEFEELMK